MECSNCRQPIIRNLTILECLLPIRSSAELCLDCQRKFQKIAFTHCPMCSRSQDSSNVCLDCQAWLRVYPKINLQHTALYQYNQGMKEWMHRFKFLGDIQLAGTFSKDLRKAILRQKVDIICPIPLAEERKNMRGYNQVEELLKAANIPYQLLLAKNENVSPQSEKNRVERLNMVQPFHLAKEINSGVRTLLIVDDVYTTGRTILHATSCFWTYPKIKIITLTLAR
ncbi:MAG: ComF family protein [Enterococcus italicus]|uniref:ComF family protein n=1 Tax=Enterococcus italicus TaxID=246144 RepID=UPI00399295AA